MRWPPLACLGTALVIAATANAGPKEERPYAVMYHPIAGCPSQAAIVADVAAHVHDDSHAAGAHVDLTIEAGKGGYEGLLVAFDERGREGSRRIEGKTCSEVANALAFLAGLAIELGGRIEPESIPPAPPPTEPTKVASATPPRVVAPTPRSIEVSAMILEGVRGGFGPGPRTSAELGVEIGAARGVLAPSVRIVGFVGQSHVESPENSLSFTLGSSSGPTAVFSPAASADLWFVGGRLEFCPLRFGNADIAVRPCLDGELGSVHGQGQIAVQPRSVVELWGSAEPTLRVQWFATKSFFAEASGGPVFPLVRTRYYFEPDRTLYVVPSLTARGAVGIGVRF